VITSLSSLEDEATSEQVTSVFVLVFKQEARLGREKDKAIFCFYEKVQLAVKKIQQMKNCLLLKR